MVFIINCTNKTTQTDMDYKQIPEYKIEKDQDLKSKRVFAETIATELLEGMRDNNFKELINNSTDDMKTQFSADVQKNTYQQIKQLYGDYKSMEYYETVENKLYTVFRYKGTFTKTEKKPEIRVVLDTEGKLAGLWIKEWIDELK